MKIKKLLIGVIIAVVSVFLVADTMLVLVPRLAGYGCYTVASGSMEPAIRRGSLLLTQEVLLENIQEKDVLTFSDKNNKIYFTHRVTRVDKLNNLIYTKGDANLLEDPAPTDYQFVKGRVEKIIPFAGYVKIAFTSPYAIVGTLAIILIGLALDIIIAKRKNLNK